MEAVGIFLTPQFRIVWPKLMSFLAKADGAPHLIGNSGAMHGPH
ncbi:hypothetical protein IMCC21224_113478 [Puniceibacterium sp. IMCC21224]|nr:hypothetical protein IMCC21224_113478 [Puniceibacterium sp. IMCC21224]